MEASVRAAGPYGVVEEYTGHGIGSAMHMDPAVPNYGRAGRGPRLEPGLALASEPRVMLGHEETVLLDDGWTVITADGSWAAHFEHTVAIMPDGPWVLTAEDGGKSGFAVLVGGTTPQDPPAPGGNLPPRPPLGGTYPPEPPAAISDTRKTDPASIPPT